MRKNKREKPTPVSGKTSNHLEPYTKVSSLAPTPPIVKGKAATTEETKNKINNSGTAP